MPVSLMIVDMEFHSPEKYKLPQIKYWYIPRKIPTGGAPDQIRAQWLNVPLPVRYNRPAEGPEPHFGHNVTDYFDVEIVPDGVTIASDDVLKALTIFGRYEAAAWWFNYFEHEGLGSTGLIFRVDEGTLMSANLMERLMPGIEEFDTIDGNY